MSILIKYVSVHTYIDTYKYDPQSTRIHTGWGVEDVDRNTVRCGEGIVGSLSLSLIVIVTRVSVYDGDGDPHYAGFNTCLEFFRSHDLLE
jgi:hypothetical protein